MERLPCAPSRGPIESWQALRNRPASPQTKKLASPFSFLLPAEKQAVFLFPYFTQAAFLRGGAKRPACQWQERPLGRRAPRESPETSGGSGSEPTRRLRLRKGGEFFGLQKMLPPHIIILHKERAAVCTAALLNFAWITCRSNRLRAAPAGGTGPDFPFRSCRLPKRRRH